MLCTWHNSEDSALQGIWTRKDWKKLVALSPLYLHKLTQKQMNSWLQTHSWIRSFPRELMLSANKQGWASFPSKLQGSITNPGARKNYGRPQTTKPAEGFRQKKGISHVRNYWIPSRRQCGSILLLLCACRRDPLPPGTHGEQAAPLPLSVTSLFLSVSCWTRTMAYTALDQDITMSYPTGSGWMSLHTPAVCQALAMLPNTSCHLGYPTSRSQTAWISLWVGKCTFFYIKYVTTN